MLGFNIYIIVVGDGKIAKWTFLLAYLIFMRIFKISTPIELQKNECAYMYFEKWIMKVNEVVNFCSLGPAYEGSM